ncbi:hypothetical protein ACB092_12G005500 [Castanea dentata]
MDHANAANVSMSWLGLASLTHQNKSKKFGAMAVRPGALRFAICHTADASSQPQNTCPAVSTFPQMSQSTSTGILRSLSLVLVGRISLHARQMKFFILFGQWSCQTDFHNDVVLVLLELSPTSNLVNCLWLIRYALRTEKTPLAVADQTL